MAKPRPHGRAQVATTAVVVDDGTDCDMWVGAPAWTFPRILRLVQSHAEVRRLVPAVWAPAPGLPLPSCELNHAAEPRRYD
jgi:hypothetical protein